MIEGDSKMKLSSLTHLLYLSVLSLFTSVNADEIGDIVLPGDPVDVVIPQIVGGVPATGSQYLFTASVQYNNGPWCGGSILNDQWILSAAHCFAGRSVSSFSAVVGTSNLNSSGERISVSRIIIHPQYNSSTSNNDIALLQLSRPISANVPTITPADTALINAAAAPGDLVTVSGWGAVYEGGPGSSTLLKVDVPVVSNSQCSSSYSGITSNMICAGYTSGGRDSCQGDSGGPLFFQYQGQYFQAGIVSFGRGCARPNYPGVYTRVSQYVDWIEDNIGGSTTPPPGGNELQNGVPVSISGGQGTALNFVLNLPNGANNLDISISGGSGDADLYVRIGAAPTLSSYDCRPYLNGNNESCSGSNLGAGAYYVMVYGYQSFSNVTLVATYN